jgi:hypothetical protein
MFQENYIDQNIGAQVQPQLSNIQCLPTQNMNLNAAPSTYGQQESKLTAAPHEESCVSKSKLMMPLSFMVEVEPFKVAELACTNLTDPVVVRPESVCAFFLNVVSLAKCLYQCDSNYLIVHVQVQPQSMEIQCLLSATPNPQASANL